MVTVLHIEKTEEGSAEEPITLAQAKAWANIDADITDSDELISSMITEARQRVEDYTNLVLVPNSVTYEVSASTPEDSFSLPYGTATEFAAVGVDADGEEVAVDSNHYIKANNTVRIKEAGRYRFTYSALTPLDSTLKQAMKKLITFWLANRGDKGNTQEGEDQILAALDKKVAIWL